MNQQIKGLYEFGEYRLDAVERLLLRGDQPIPLTPKAFDTLLVLVKHSGHLLGKDVLMKEVWSDAFVEEANLARNVWTLRRALGEDEGEHRYIETVPKIGYRFVAPVRELDRTESDLSERTPLIDSSAIIDASIVDPIQSHVANESYKSVNANNVVQLHQAVVQQKRGFPIGSRLPVLLVVFTILIFAAVYLSFAFRRTRAKSEPPIRTLAILPLKSLSGNPNDDYLGLGIANTLITKVNQSGAITVRPYSAVQKYAGQQTDSLKAAQELQVDAVLDATFQRDGDRIRVSVNLIRVQDGFSLFAENFDERFADIFKMQDEVGRKIATRLRIKLRETKPHPDPNAYDLYLKAKYFGGLLNSADNDEAIRLLQHAIEIDPNFAAAYADLATEYRNKSVSLSASDKGLEDKALSAVTTALRLDPDLAEAHLSKCLLLWTPAKGFPHAIAIDECRRALELNPNLDEAHHHLANMYNHIGLLDKGHEEVLKALEINPGNIGARFRVGVNLTYQSKYDQALTALGESTKFSPHLWSFQVAYVLFELGRKGESAAIVEKYLKEFPQDEGGTLTSMKALLAASAGNTKEALANINRAAEIGKDYIHFHHTTYTIASTYALLNKREEALEWLRKTADTGFPCYPLFERDPNLNNLREDPKFQAFMKTLKEQWEGYKATL